MSTTDHIRADFLVAKYNHQYSLHEIEAFYDIFRSFDKNGDGSIDRAECIQVCERANERYDDEMVTKYMKEIDADGDGRISFEEFLHVMLKMRDATGLGRMSKKIQTITGSNSNITHSVSDDEKQSFTQHINDRLRSDADIGSRFPIALDGSQLYAECKDGLLLSKLINDSVPGTIDERVMNMSKFSMFQMTENNNVVINSAKAIGCSVVNIGAQDLMEGKEHLILGLIWQIIRIGLNSKIDIRIHPELFRLLEPGETLDDLLKMSAEAILLRWFNYHLKKADWPRKVNNFGGDIKDSENYIVLLSQLAPDLCDRKPLSETALGNRAEMLLANADKLGCRKYVTARTICNGNTKLNFAFVANLFNTHPCLEPLSEQEKAALDDWLFNSQGDREARAFALWMNSLNANPFVANLFEDLRDGLVLLQTFDAIHPGIVEWKKVNKVPTIRFKKVENTNYAIIIGKSVKYTLVGIQGADITDGSKTLTLGLVWQMMRDHIITTLKTLNVEGKDIKDDDIIRWANDCVVRGGRATRIVNFRDSSIKTGKFLIDLCNGIKKGIVDYSLVTDGLNDDDAKLNAKYAISIARKLGATIFVLPEDIVEVKPKMILTFVGTLNALDRLVNRA